jgi:L-asparagine oxygenase
MSPVHGSAASLTTSPAFLPLRLPKADRQAWTQRAALLRYPDYRDLEAWLAFRDQAAALAREFLPPDIAAALRDFFQPAGEPVLVIENLPVDPQLPPAPLDGMRPASKQAVSEAVIVGLLAGRAEILAFVNEKGGSPIHEVAPIPGLEDVQSNAGRVRFGFHSDNAFLPPQFRQRGILLYGLHNQDTATTVITAEQILEAAPPGLADALARPAFRHACPASYSFDQPAFSAPYPILHRDAGGIARVSAASSRIEPVDPAAAAALAQFRELLETLEPARVVVAPGTALLFKDDRVLHGRDRFTGPRWLQRAYFTDSLDPQRAATGSDQRAFAFDARVLLAAERAQNLSRQAGEQK